MQNNLSGIAPSYPKSSLINGRYDPQLADALTKVSPRPKRNPAPRRRTSKHCS